MSPSSSSSERSHRSSSSSFATRIDHRHDIDTTRSIHRNEPTFTSSFGTRRTLLRFHRHAAADLPIPSLTSIGTKPIPPRLALRIDLSLDRSLALRQHFELFSQRIDLPYSSHSCSSHSTSYSTRYDPSIPTATRVASIFHSAARLLADPLDEFTISPDNF